MKFGKCTFLVVRCMYKLYCLSLKIWLHLPSENLLWGGVDSGVKVPSALKFLLTPPKPACGADVFVLS